MQWKLSPNAFNLFLPRISVLMVWRLIAIILWAIKQLLPSPFIKGVTLTHCR